MIKKRIIRFVPLIICILIIWGLSIQSVDGTMKLSNGTRYYVDSLVTGVGIDTSDNWWNDSSNFRKLGHVIEFFALGAIAFLTVKHMRISLVICACVSLIDQTIKIFVPVRHFDANDLLFDAIGYVIPIIIGFIVVSKHRKE